MKRILAFISVLTVAGLVMVTSGVAFADQVYHTDRLPMHSLALSEYCLRNGMVINLHPNGPNNMSIEHFMVNGAKPNTTFTICRVFQEDLYFDVDGDGDAEFTSPAGWPGFAGFIHTDGNGNGNCTLKLSPEDLASLLTREFHAKFVLVEGGYLAWEYYWFGGTPAYETDFFEAILD